MKVIQRTLKAFFYMFFLMKKIRPKRLKTMPLSIVFTTIKPFISVIFPALIIDNLLNGSELRIILLLIAIMCLSEIILTFILEIIREHNTVNGACFIFQLTGVVLEKYMELDMEDIENPEIYHKYSMADSALDAHVDGFISQTETLIIQILELIGTSIIIATLHPIIVVIVSVFTFFLSYIQKARLKTEREFDDSTISERRKYNYLYDTVNDFEYGKEIRIYGIRKKIIARVEAVNNSIYLKFKKSREKSNAIQTVYNILIYLQQAGIYGYMIFSFAINAISVGGFLLYLRSIERFKNVLSSIGNLMAAMNQMGNRICDIQNFLSIESKLNNTQKEGTQVTKCKKFDICFVNVGFHYPDNDIMVLKNINITIPYGEKLTIVGENGAGKSTFIKLLLRIYDPTEGEIYLGGINIRDFPLDEYHSMLAAVFQDYKMLSFTVRENITFGSESEVSDEKIFKILQLLKIENKIKNLPEGLDTYLNNDFEENGTQMSGGETQKLAIARALYRNAPIFIMDEPTSALDAIAEMEIYELAYSIAQERTCIFISHRMSTARSADKIALFDHGNITEYGTYQELMGKKGLFYELYQLQAKYYINNENAVKKSGENI